LRGIPGHGEEDVVKVGAVDRELLDCDVARVELVEQAAERRDVAVAGDAEDEPFLVWCGSVEKDSGCAQGRGVGELEADVPAGDTPFQLVGRALRDDPAAVEDGDPIGELVGLVEVLRGQEDGDAAGREIADAVPHLAAAARVEPGGGLVEEDHLRRPDQRHGQVEAPAHSARVCRGRPRGSVDEPEPVE
jgi:hypothetical protein